MDIFTAGRGCQPQVRERIDIVEAEHLCPPAYRPHVHALSRRGDFMSNGGVNLAWVAARIAADLPAHMAATQARREYLAVGAILEYGRVTGVRGVVVAKARFGFADYYLDPAAGWSRRGATAVPIGRLP